MVILYRLLFKFLNFFPSLIECALLNHQVLLLSSFQVQSCVRKLYEMKWNDLKRPYWRDFSIRQKKNKVSKYIIAILFVLLIEKWVIYMCKKKITHNLSVTETIICSICCKSVDNQLNIHNGSETKVINVAVPKEVREKNV